MPVWPGAPAPLGVTYDGGGVNVAAFSSSAEMVEVCLFDEDGTETRVRLPERSGDVWHGYLPEVLPGTCYGLRVSGPFDAGRGLQPTRQAAARPLRPRIEGDIQWDEAVFGYRFDDDGPDFMSDEDSAPFVPALRGRRRGLQLGGRSPAAHPLARPRHLRGARQRSDALSPGHRPSSAAARTSASATRCSSATCKSSASPH